MDTQAIASALSDWIVQLLMPVLVALVGRAVLIARNWNINATVARAIGRAAGAAYMTLLEDRRGTDATAVNRAVNEAVAFVNDGPSVVPLLAKAGIDATRLEQLIRAELGNKFADDPNVKVG